MIFIRLIQFFFLSTILCFGAWLIYSGLRKKKRSGLIFGIMLTAIVISLVVRNIALDVMMDWNPKIIRPAEVIGVYADNKESVELRPDNTFTYKADGHNTEGKWKRDDWNVYLDPVVKNQKIRFVRFAGALRLMTQASDDPDNWDGNPGLKRIKTQ